MLVTDDANDRVLLGRQAVWPPRRFSTLAGFVSPGESLEEAVRRVGTDIDKVKGYLAAHPPIAAREGGEPLCRARAGIGPAWCG